MKKGTILLSPTLMMAAAVICYGQFPKNEAMPETIALRMKDTLSLTTTQASNIRNINLNLDSQKLVARQAKLRPDSLFLKITHIENSRDSLYRGILADETKYQLYLQKKLNILKLAP